MQPHGFLNRKLKEAKQSSSHEKIIRIVPVMMKEDRPWSKELIGWKGFVSESILKDFLSLRSKSGKSSKQEFELFIPTSQTFQKPTSYIPLQPVTYSSILK